MEKNMSRNLPVVLKRLIIFFFIILHYTKLKFTNNTMTLVDCIVTATNGSHALNNQLLWLKKSMRRSQYLNKKLLDMSLYNIGRPVVVRNTNLRNAIRGLWYASLLYSMTRIMILHVPNSARFRNNNDSELWHRPHFSSSHRPLKHELFKNILRVVLYVQNVLSCSNPKIRDNKIAHTVCFV